MEKFEVGQRVQVITLEELKKNGKISEEKQGFYEHNGNLFWLSDLLLCGEYGEVIYEYHEKNECAVKLESSQTTAYIKSCFLRPAGSVQEEAYKRMTDLRNEADNIEQEIFKNSRFIATEDDFGVTEGKVYKLEDGVFTNDDGEKFNIEMPGDFEFEIGVKFVRVKEDYELCEQKIPF